MNRLTYELVRAWLVTDFTNVPWWLEADKDAVDFSSGAWNIRFGAEEASETETAHVVFVTPQLIEWVHFNSLLSNGDAPLQPAVMDQARVNVEITVGVNFGRGQSFQLADLAASKIDLITKYSGDSMAGADLSHLRSFDGKTALAQRPPYLQGRIVNTRFLSEEWVTGDPTPDPVFISKTFQCLIERSAIV